MTVGTMFLNLIRHSLHSGTNCLYLKKSYKIKQKHTFSTEKWGEKIMQKKANSSALN